MGLVHRHILVLVVSLLSTLAVTGQILHTPHQEKINADSIRADFDSRPYFGLYKDNYFTVGTAVKQKPSHYNSDVKFQVSFSQLLTRRVLPLHS